MLLIGQSPSTPLAFCRIQGSTHQPPPSFQTEKSLLQLAGAQIRVQKTYHFPSTTFFLLSTTIFAVSHSTRHFLLQHTHLRFVALHPFPPSNRLRRRIQWASASMANTDRDTSSPVAPTPRHLLWEHTALRVVNTLNGLSADAKHRLAAWAPWAYQSINFASGLT